MSYQGLPVATSGYQGLPGATSGYKLPQYLPKRDLLYQVLGASVFIYHCVVYCTSLLTTVHGIQNTIQSK